MLPKKAKITFKTKDESAHQYMMRVRKKVAQLDKASDAEPMLANTSGDNEEPIPEGSPFKPRKVQLKIRRQKKEDTASYRKEYDTFYNKPKPLPPAVSE